MFRLFLGSAALTAALAAPLAAQATDLLRCPPARAHHHRHPAVSYRAPQVVYGAARPVPRHAYNYEDNGRYDGADVPPPGTRRLAYGQPPSWLDGYGTRPVVYGAYGPYNVYGGSAQVMPTELPAAGGLAVYSPGAYGPGPAIIAVPPGY